MDRYSASYSEDMEIGALTRSAKALGVSLAVEPILGSGYYRVIRSEVSSK
jgi:hypothetical protein